jgi:hypothetical protein
MNEHARTQTARPAAPAQRQQQVFLRAVVGSLMLCAALAPATAQAAAVNAAGQGGAHWATSAGLLGRRVLQFLPAERKPASAPGRLALQQPPVVLNNMTVSANGKRLCRLPEMSRATAGNLLRQHLSIP